MNLRSLSLGAAARALVATCAIGGLTAASAPALAEGRGFPMSPGQQLNTNGFTFKTGPVSLRDVQLHNSFMGTHFTPPPPGTTFKTPPPKNGGKDSVAALKDRIVAAVQKAAKDNKGKSDADIKAAVEQAIETALAGAPADVQNAAMAQAAVAIRSDPTLQSVASVTQAVKTEQTKVLATAITDAVTKAANANPKDKNAAKAAADAAIKTALDTASAGGALPSDARENALNQASTAIAQNTALSSTFVGINNNKANNTASIVMASRPPSQLQSNRSDYRPAI